MILKIAWRNIWRSRTRSLVVVGAIALGVWSVLFLMGFSQGLIEGYIANLIESELSHIQIHHPEYKKDYDIQFARSNPDPQAAEIAAVPGVKALTNRTLVNGMISSSKGARGIRVKGVDPAPEAIVTNLDKKILEGAYFPEGKKNQILVGRSLADKLGLKLRTKIVLTFQNLEGEITASAFRITGIFETDNKQYDESQVFVMREELNGLLGAPGLGHETAILVDQNEDMAPVAAALRLKYPDQLVETYRQISPEADLFDSQLQLSSVIFMTIVMLALAFGIVNTMLMAVLERVRELGMLMAVGMNKLRVFLMIVTETILLGMIGAPIGLGLGALTISSLGHTGMDLSMWSKGMQEFGISEMVYPALDPALYGQLVFAVLITAVIGSIYPALKAIRLRPVDAIHKV